MVLPKQICRKSIFLNVNECDIFRLNYSYNRWYIDECYGFNVKKEDFEKNAKVLYLNTNIAENIVNKSNKVVFVKLNKQEVLEKNIR